MTGITSYSEAQREEYTFGSCLNLQLKRSREASVVALSN